MNAQDLGQISPPHDSVPSASAGLRSIGGVGLSVTVALALLASVLLAPVARAAEPCPNEAIREAQGVTALPNCMALEMVSPPRKFVEAAVEPVISLDEERVRFKSTAGLAETPGLQSPGGDRYVATRGSEGWITAPTSAPTAAELSGIGGGNNGGPYAYAADLTRWTLFGGTQVQTNAGVFRIFQGGLDGSFEPLSPLLVPINESGSEGLAAELGSVESTATSMDLSTTIVHPGLIPTSYLPSDPAINEENSGRDFNNYVASLDADGEPSIELLARDKDGKTWGGECGAHAGGGIGFFGVIAGSLNQGAISEDGSRIYVSTPPAQPIGKKCGPLRILKRTKTLAGPEISPLLSGGQADWEEAGDDLYQGASQDGTKVYFTTVRPLAGSDLDSGSECSRKPGSSSGCDLYLYDSEKPLADRVTQVSTGGIGDPEPGKGANVLSSITAISGDGSHAYFVAEGVLSGENSEHLSPSVGKPNLYLYERDSAHPGGRISFIGVLDSSDQDNLWGAEGSFITDAYTAPLLGKNPGGQEIGGDGHILAFVSRASLTFADKDAGYSDIYRYDAEAESLSCVSCSDRGVEENFDVSINRAAGLPSSAFAVEGRWVSEGGQVVGFSTAEKLAPGDEDEAVNAYIWDGGSLYKLPGSGSQRFPGGPTVSKNGNEIAYSAFTALLPPDGDSTADIYVARAGGGFQNPEARDICASEESCQGARALRPSALGPTSLGPGNQSRQPIKCKKGFVRKKGKCVRRPHSKKGKHSNSQSKRSGQKRGA